MNLIIIISNVIDKYIRQIIAIVLIVMTVVLSSQVIARYLMGTGLTWSEEIVRYMCIWMVFLGATSAQKEGSQISVTALEELLPPLPQNILMWIQKIFVIVYSGIVMWIGFNTLKVASTQASPNMRIPMNYVYIVIPISMIIMLIHLASILLVDISAKRLGR
ncbi:TRAP transporter small permease [Gudongella sp. DL1XJH-153]|uniref:TRAP transporter small permease n=1 Tax=Gudongella sp. DL1XJH-153 TaxID=3409804 RepID=UPI003BB4D872